MPSTTDPVNPPRGVLRILNVVLWPAMTGCDGGEAERMKGAALTISVTLLVWFRLPLVPVMGIV